MCWGLFSFCFLTACLLISLMCSALSVFHLVAVCLLISLMYCRCSAFRFLTVCLRSLFFLISDCLLISLLCSGFFAYCFIMVCLLIPLMCSKVFAFHFLKEHYSIFLTCSGSSFIFLAAWFFLSLVVLLLMQLLCGKLPFSLFLNFLSASICIPLCRLFCKLYSSSCYQLDCFHLHFVHICCCL